MNQSFIRFSNITIIPKSTLLCLISTGLMWGVNLLIASSAGALGFTGAYDQNNWTATYGGLLATDTSDGYIDAYFAPDAITVSGPVNQTSASSYIDWYITMPGSGVVHSVSFAWSFTSDDLTINDDKAYYIINNNAPVLLASWDGQFDYGQGIPIPMTGNKTVVLAAGNKLTFRVLSVQNRVDNDPDYDGRGYLAISNFDVQTSIPFAFNPTSGVFYLGTLWGIHQWRKKQQNHKTKLTSNLSQNLPTKLPTNLTR